MLHAPQCKPFATPPFAARPAQITAAAAPRCKLHYLQSDASRRRQRGLCATWRVRDTGLAGRTCRARNLLIRTTLTATASGTTVIHPHEFYAIHLMRSPRCHLNAVVALCTKMNCTLHFATGLRGV